MRFADAVAKGVQKTTDKSWMLRLESCRAPTLQPFLTQVM
jgi:hypothetical protein